MQNKQRHRHKIEIDKNHIEFVNPSSKPSTIKSIQFTMFNQLEMSKASELEIVESNMFEQGTRKPNPNGVLDRKLGVCDSINVCNTCGKKVDECCGHFGHITLALPVFHIGFIRPIVQVLQCVCKNCNRLLLTDDERSVYLKKMTNKSADTVARTFYVRALIAQCRKRYDCCPHCNSINGPIKRVGVMHLIHEKYKTTSTNVEIKEFYDNFSESLRLDKDIKPYLTYAQEELTPVRVLTIFRSLVREDIIALDFDPDRAPPENMILTSIPVAPLTIRPSVAMDGGNASNEDDVTTQLRDIVECNKKINAITTRALPYQNYIESWDALTIAVSLVINSDLPGIDAPGKPLRAFCQRLKGKHGRFRGNLLGKRVDFSGRTVISPDPNLDIEQLGVPKKMAVKLTYPEKVTRYNIEKLRERVRNGPDVYPGCNGIVMLDGAKRSMNIKQEMRAKFAKELKIGEIVERHLEDNDIVLFNRQPSLHRISIMCHRAKILPWRTLRFNECACTPYNADFDGDEMNLHVPQSEEARAECLILMHSAKNLQTPRTGDVIIAETQDFLTVSYLLTSKDFFITYEDMQQWACWFHNAGIHVCLPPPAILKPRKLWTGKQLYGLALSPNPRDGVKITLDVPNKSYTKSGKWMCIKDGWIHFRNSVLLSGRIDKSIVGGGNKSGLFHLILRDHGTLVAAQIMAHISRFCARFLGELGFSIGISDVTPSFTLSKMKDDLVDAGYKKCSEFIDDYKNGKQAIQAGSTPEQTLESLLNSELSEIREHAGKRCIEELRYDNAPLVMALSGSKGSTINISQMIACVGQQTVNGNRVSDGFISRSLPHFPLHSRTPQAKGFVRNSFFTGLNATEFFFHTMGGREGLVDSAVKTAETGYMQRRLMKALEDLHVHYDGTVRNASLTVIEFRYGDDGIDPLKVESAQSPLNYESILQNLQATQTPNDEFLTPFDLKEKYDQICKNQPVNTTSSNYWKTQLDVFIEEKLQYLTNVYNTYSSQNICNNICGITKKTLSQLVETCISKAARSICEPGTPVGALAGQSMGEPCTQMVLKTFHFAGVASMNITLGSRIESTTLKEIASSIRIVFKPEEAFISVELDLATIRTLQLECTIESVKKSIIANKRCKLKEKQITIRSLRKLRNTSLLFVMNTLRSALLDVIVCGIDGIGRAVINQSKSGYELLVEGTEFLKVIGVPGIVGVQSFANHIIVVEKVLGIEAARQTIINEIKTVMEAHGLSVDVRHLLLLSDLMTFKGMILGITRYGISKMKDSVFMLASFERTNDHLFDAAVHARNDVMKGVSECIIVGNQVSLGTGLMKVLYDPPKPVFLTSKYKPLF
ncbi:DNA-directed RNA polymerase subunit [Entamoeba marina]